MAPCQDAGLGQPLGFGVLGGTSVAAAAPSPGGCLADWGQLSWGLCSPLWLSGPHCRNFSGFFCKLVVLSSVLGQILDGFIQQWTETENKTLQMHLVQGRLLSAEVLQLAGG